MVRKIRLKLKDKLNILHLDMTKCKYGYQMIRKSGEGYQVIRGSG
jgi:phosphotransferase system IIB component